MSTAKSLFDEQGRGSAAKRESSVDAVAADLGPTHLAGAKPEGAYVLEKRIRPRIIHIITGLTIGGAETALFRLIVSSMGGEYDHCVIALTSGGSMTGLFRAEGIELVMLDFRRAPIAGFFRLLSVLRTMRPDVVQTWLYHADLLGGLAARMVGIRNVIWGIRTTMVTAGSCSPLTARVRQLCAWMSTWMPRTIVCVAEAARKAHAGIGYDPSRMVVIGNGFDMSRFEIAPGQRDTMRRQFGFAADDVVIGIVGRFNTDKDHRSFVRAAGVLARKHSQVRFLMVGPKLDASNAELAGWIAETGHPERFVLAGERGDVPACLSAMDIFCLSSRNEGFPNAVGEAMAVGLPCVATDVGDVRTVVADTGVVVPKEDYQALARGLERILTLTPDERRHMGERAKARIHKEFTMERARERFESIYRDMVAGGGA